MARRIDGMVCLITGASSGIGAALARELHRRGARLVLAARRADKLDALCQALGGDHLAVPTDVADPAACEALFTSAVQRFGRLDTLIANAGYGLAKPVVDTSPAEMQRIFAVNVLGTHNCVRPAVAVMRRQEVHDGWRGQIVITSSGAARRGLPFFGPYSATKASQLSLAESLRVELSPERIAVTSVHPIGTATDFFDIAEGGGTVKVQGVGPRGRQQTPEHVARRMADAIARPVREVWPARSYRYLLGLNSMLPGIGDAVMTHMRRQIETAGQNHKDAKAQWPDTKE